MIILVGGGGFIGSHIRRRLTVLGPTSVVIVSDNTPQLPLRPNERLVTRAEFAGASGSGLIERANSIVYLATASTVATFTEAPWDELVQNVDPFFRFLLRVSEINPRCKIVFASSGGTVYGTTDDRRPIPESHPLRPISPYGLGKVMQEEALAFVSRTKGLAFNVLRLANPVGVYGRSHSQGLVTAALRAAATNVSLPLFGDGSHVRDVFDADDAADALVLAIADRDHPTAVWNIGSGVGVSNIQIIEMVERVVRQKISLDLRPARETDVAFIVLDTTRARSELGWSPTRRLEDTIGEIWHTNFAANPS